MQTITEMALEKADRGIFTRDQAALWAGNRGMRLDALLKRAVASKEIWRIRRGLYCLSNRYTRRTINPLELAQLVHGPSYISMETALSRHGWIPEGVQAITSVSLNRSRILESPIGLFTFTRVPQFRFLSGVRRVAADDQGSFFMATPLKALADLVYAQRHKWTSLLPITESLRIEEESLATLTTDLFNEVLSAYGSGHVRSFLNAIRKDLKL